ncbi:hypothetical protein [Bacillus benzoevorans]|uniref:Uncharacterized protein n=1 Tax=Bacillus benzoevorans TaxID=1456 RepID=A0A7X0LV77_9BACI|nr:hypothetical protein [Bacillus benzoevorans]MBB6444014.1 hypothetical protein [Bacillus benzoevorans]
MDLIEVYVEDVKNRLPQRLRSGAEKELRALIEEKLPEGFTHEDVQRILQDLGSPAEWVFTYRLKGKKYLIAPPYFEKYIRFVVLFALIFLFITSFSIIIERFLAIKEEIHIVSFIVALFIDIFVSAFDAFAHVFLWVTIGFMIMEWVGIPAERIPSINTLWFPNYKQKRTISRAEVLFSLFWIVIWLILLFHADKWLGWYEQTGSSFESLTLIAPLFKQNILISYFPLLLGLALIEFALGVIKLAYARWTFKISFFNLIYHTLSITLLCVMLSNPDLFHPQFLTLMDGNLKLGGATFAANWNKLIWGFALFVILFSLIDIAKGFYHSIKDR